MPPKKKLKLLVGQRSILPFVKKDVRTMNKSIGTTDSARPSTSADSKSGESTATVSTTTGTEVKEHGKQVCPLPPTDDSGQMMDAPPTSITHFPWIYERRKENCRRNTFRPEESGKWMMFYPKKEIDDAWARAKNLYRTGQLPDIRSMKVSTEMPAGYSGKTSVMIFYCGPAWDEARVKAVGKDLVKKMRYKRHQISYKTDAQTRQGIEGSTYTIRLP